MAAGNAAETSGMFAGQMPGKVRSTSRRLTGD
jgi:hypothetical protein